MVSTATPAVLGLSFHCNLRVILPVPSIRLAPSINFAIPPTTVNRALQSVPSPSFKHKLLPASSTKIGLLAGFNPV